MPLLLLRGNTAGHCSGGAGGCCRCSRGQTQLIAHLKLLLDADLRGLVVLQQRVVALGLHDLLPADVLSVAEVIIF